VVPESDSDGFFAYCPDLQGCYTQGRTFEEAIANIRDAVRLHLEDRLARGDPILQRAH
jgi:predicted RNase H-like HicB family nuclease